jgi:hypothetical protein
VEAGGAPGRSHAEQAIDPEIDAERVLRERRAGQHDDRTADERRRVSRQA